MIIFENGGEIDVRAITTMGVNVKTNENPIGYFGTGLKYAIAVLLRMGHQIEIQSGETTYAFDKKNVLIRGEQFDIVCMNGEELGFTTQLGKNWRLWQVLRELYCNCEDELGRSRLAKKAPKPKAGTTRVLVVGHDFEKVYEQDLEDIILKSKSIARSEHASIHPGKGKHIFFRGIRAYDLDGIHAKFDYNIQDEVQLTEDRTIRNLNEATRAIAFHVMKSEDEDFIHSVLTCPNGTLERRISDFDHWNAPQPSEAFFAAIERARKDRSKPINASAMRVYKAHKGVAETFTQASLSEQQGFLLKRCVAWCHKLRFPVDEYEIVITETLGENVLGLAERGKIFLAQRCFDMGTKTVCSTLIEEFIHLRHGYDDESRSMQNFLFDTLVSLGAELHGEPV